MFPLRTEPVTTFPKPLTLKTLSTYNLKRSPFSFSSTSEIIVSIDLISSSFPCPVTAETPITGAFFNEVFSRNSITSYLAISANSSSTRSILVRATIPFFIPKALIIFRCSMV